MGRRRNLQLPACCPHPPILSARLTGLMWLLLWVCSFQNLAGNLT